MLDKHYPVVHSNGLNKDRLFQDSNDVTFALNAIRDNHEGGRQEYQSEPGNDISASLPAGYITVGSIYGQNEEIYILSTNGTLSEIGLFKLDTYTTLANLNLGFSLDYPITGEYRVRNGCERTIYWCDKLNPDYWYNIDKPEEFKTLGSFDPNKFKHVPVILPIDVDLISVNDSGGILPLGSYYFQPEILDANLNVIYSGDISPQTIVYDDNQNSNYYNIDGGLNIEQYDPAIGGVPITNKSITLEFSRLDTSFSYLRVNVFRAINGTQVLDAHTVATLIPISGTSIEWTYQGYNTSAGDFPIDVSEKLVENITYQSAYVSEQVQNRYVRANLKQDSRDYSNYQQFASTITMKWVAKETEAANAKAKGNPKNPSTYWYDRGFQGDEVYAPGIIYLHDDGVVSPVFPCIGRQATVDDLEILTVVANNAVLGPLDVWLSDVEHLGLDLNAQVPRWKVFNTAWVTDVQLTTHPYTYEGEFSYYESDETYPDIRDCDNNLLWGVDSNSDPITTDTKIRLIKFPDRRLISHISVDGTYTIPFGIKFENITYPNSSIIGHKFVYADRTEFDKTVVDSGWSVTPDYSDNLGDGNFWIRLGKTKVGLFGAINIPDPFRHQFYNTALPQSHYLRYYSNNILYNKNVGSFDYYKTNRVHRFGTGLITTDADNSYSFIDLDTGGKLYSIIRNMDHKNYITPTRTNHTERQTFYVESKGIITAQNLLPNIVSDDLFTSDSISYVNYGLENTDPLLGAQVINSLHNGNNTQFEVNNFYTYKKTLIVPYKNFLSRIFKSTNHNFTYSQLAGDNIFYGGDTLILEGSAFRNTAYYKTDNAHLNYLYSNSFSHHFTEHFINSNLRHSGFESNFKYFKHYSVSGDQYNYDKVSELNDVNNRVLKSQGVFKLSETFSFTDVPEEYYAYNKDFSLRLFEKSKVALPLQYDYCSGCSGFYPNRIIFSPKSFDEESFDLYRINKVNDYIDMPAHRGAITGLKYQNNQLLVHMEDSTFVLQPNPQQISTDQNTAYLTTGDFLSVPPQELMQTDVGTGGLQSKQSMCNTPFGHCWADQKRGEVFSWNGQIEMLSNKGLSQWFKENLPSELDIEYFKVNGTKYPITSTLSLESKGVILYYDPRFKRLMVTKKEALPISLIYSFDDYAQANDILYSEELGWITLGDDGPVPVNISDPDFFINKSWTISYEFLNQSWTSWHSYTPYYSFADSNNFYTSVYGSQIWKHLSKEKYQSYYGQKYDFIIEWQNMDPVTSSVDSIHYVGYSQIWDSVNKQFKTVDTTFNKALVYNFEQSTGLFNLQLQTGPYSNNKLGSGTKDVIKTDMNYKISGIYDMATAQPVITKDWNLLQLNSGYIDHVSNTANINLNKSPYISGNVWDKFVFVRLFYKPILDHKKSVLLQVLNTQQSIR